jgi:hypothetical protein
MEDVVDPFSSTPTANLRGQIDRPKFDVVFVRFDVFDATPGEIVRNDDITLFLQESVDEVTAEESGTTCHEYAAAAKVHATGASARGNIASAIELTNRQTQYPGPITSDNGWVSGRRVGQTHDPHRVLPS